MSELHRSSSNPSGNNKSDQPECDCKLMFKFSESPYKTKTWRHPIEFTLAFASCLFRNSGLYLFLGFCSKYGGLSFTFAYSITLAVVGLPTVLIVTAIGQHSKYGPLGCWNYSRFMKFFGVSLLLTSAVYRAAQFVIASESIYLATMLIESFNDTMGDDSKCQSKLLSGFCHLEAEVNKSRDACVNYSNEQVEWGICGNISETRSDMARQKNLTNHYLWEKVLIFDSTRAAENFAGPKLQTTDLLTGKMQQGFQIDTKLEKAMHWNLMTFVFSLSYFGLLSVLILSQDTIWTLMHVLSLSSSVCLSIANLVAAASSSVSDSNAFIYGWYQFSSNQLNSGLWMQPAIWVDALLLAMWNTGIMSGELISIAKLNLAGQNTMLTCLLEIAGHCLLNGLNALCVCTMQVHYFKAHHTAPFESYGFTHLLMEVYPNILIDVYYVLGFLPLGCFAVDELCAVVSFKNSVVYSLIDIWPKLDALKPVLYLLLFIVFIIICTPLCIRYNMAVVYDYIRITWGWNCVLLIAIMMLSFWCYLRPTTAVFVLFKRLGSSYQVIKLNNWWRLCWLFYTPVLLVFSLFALAYESVRQSSVTSGIGRMFYSGPLQMLSDGQLKRYLWDWWIVDILRTLTLVPILIGSVLALCQSNDASKEKLGNAKTEEKSATVIDGETKSERVERYRDTWKELSEDLMFYKRD